MTTTLIGLFSRASTMPEVIVHAWILSNFGSEPICTSRFATVATKTITSNLIGIYICTATRTSRGTSSSVIITFRAYFLSLGSPGSSSKAALGTGLESKKNIFHSGGKMPFTNLSMNGVPERTRTAKAMYNADNYSYCRVTYSDVPH